MSKPIAKLKIVATADHSQNCSNVLAALEDVDLPENVLVELVAKDKHTAHALTAKHPEAVPFFFERWGKQSHWRVDVHYDGGCMDYLLEVGDDLSSSLVYSTYRIRLFFTRKGLLSLTDEDGDG